jgi:hypothetical protein
MQASSSSSERIVNRVKLVSDGRFSLEAGTLGDIMVTSTNMRLIEAKHAGFCTAAEESDDESSDEDDDDDGAAGAAGGTGAAAAGGAGAAAMVSD